ncbi:MAG: nSTAND1 domain-containing NTPase [Aggregatilineales bacterium]
MTGTGQVVRGYELHERIGAGGFGEVYRAYQADVAREVAIKVIAPQYVNRPEFIRRFEVEAHLVARLEHIHIVPLYDYWREPAGAYLVMRWLPGNLRNVLKEGVPPLNNTATWLDQITSGLTIAHRHNVIHCDLKPDNILLDDEGNAFLADFGIAKVLTDSDDPERDIIGSPDYLSPEQIRLEKLTPQTDIYSLGVMLYELLVGIPPFVGCPPDQLPLKHLYEILPALSLSRPDLPTALNSVVQRATQKDPAARYPDVAALSLEFRTAVGSAVEQQAPTNASPLTSRSTIIVRTEAKSVTTSIDVTTPGFKINPYMGLRAFNESDAHQFFGRTELTRRMVSRLAHSKTRLLAVVGPSGSGKTSVVMAGLIPALRQGEIPGSNEWFEIELTPNAKPIEKLEAALLSVAVTLPPDMAEQLVADRFGLVNVVKQILPDTGDKERTLLIVIDQFEEVFTQIETEAEITQFLELIHAAVTTPDSPVYVILTLRADFYDRPLLYPEFGELMRIHTEIVLPLTTAELTDAIIRPIAHVGVSMEPQLLAAIIRDVGEQPGTLPLLQYALTELYERSDGQMLTLAGYAATGGVLGALTKRAHDLYNGLDEPGKLLAQQLFLRLITLGEGTEDTRRRVRQSELLSISEDSKRLQSVIDLYSKYWLLTFDIDPILRVPTVEIAHEALIQRWDKVQVWLTISREEVRLQRVISAEATEWLRNGRDVEYLAIGARLAQFEKLAQAGHVALSADERAYLVASVLAQKSHEQSQMEMGARTAHLAKVAVSAQATASNRLHYLIGVLLIFLLVASGLSVVALRNAQDAQASAQQAQQESLAAQNEASRARSLYLAGAAVTAARKDEGELATLLALKSLNNQYTLEGDAALQEALAHNYDERIFPNSFAGNPAPVKDAVFSPDGTVIALVSDVRGSPIQLLDRNTGTPVRTFSGDPGGMTGIAFSHDSKWLLTVNADGTVSQWDRMSGKQLHHWQARQFNTAVFSPDDQEILTANSDQTARLWDVQTGQELQQYKGHTASVNSAVFSADGHFVLTASQDGTVILFERQTGTVIHTYTTQAGERLNSAALSPDGRLIAAGGYKEVVYVWDAEFGRLLYTFEGHSDEVKRVAFSPDGKYIASASADLRAIVWKWKDVYGTGTIDPGSGTIDRSYIGHTDTVNRVSFSPDGTSILTADDDGTARLWYTSSAVLPNNPLPHQFTGHTGPVYYATYSPDGKLIASASKDGTARIWDVSTGKQTLLYNGHSERIWWIAVSNDGTNAATASDDATVQIWDVKTGKMLQTLKHSGTVWAVAFSPDGTRLITGGQDRNGYIWDIQTGAQLLALKGHTDSVYGVAYSPDGQYVVTASIDKTAILWNASTGAKIRRFTGTRNHPGHTDQVYAVAFSHNGKYIATASRDQTAIVWDVHTGTPVRVFSGHNDVVWTVQFSPDDTQLLTAGQDGTARLWDIWGVDAGKEFRRFTGYNATVASATFSPDGTWVLTTSYDYTIRLMSADYQTLKKAACGLLLRDLTDAERAEYGIVNMSPTC